MTTLTTDAPSLYYILGCFPPASILDHNTTYWIADRSGPARTSAVKGVNEGDVRWPEDDPAQLLTALQIECDIRNAYVIIPFLSAFFFVVIARDMPAYGFHA